MVTRCKKVQNPNPPSALWAHADCQSKSDCRRGVIEGLSNRLQEIACDRHYTRFKSTIALVDEMKALEWPLCDAVMSLTIVLLSNAHTRCSRVARGITHRLRFNEVISCALLRVRLQKKKITLPMKPIASIKKAPKISWESRWTSLTRATAWHKWS